MKTADLCRKYGISEATFYNWKYGGLEVSEAKRLKSAIIGAWALARSAANHPPAGQCLRADSRVAPMRLSPCRPLQTA